MYEIVYGKLKMGNVYLTDIVDEFGTPAYVTDEEKIRQKFRRLRNAFTKSQLSPRIYYSCKANSNISVLAILKNEGAYVDAASTGEVFLCLKAGFEPERILFTSTSVHKEDFQFLIKNNIMVNIDSFSQLHNLAKINNNIKILIRVNPEIRAGHHEYCMTAERTSKFGIPMDRIVSAFQEAKEYNFNILGIHFHLGSGILEIKPYVTAFKNIMNICREIEKTIDINLKIINMGGGFGIPYSLNDGEFDLDALAERIAEIIRKEDRILAIEPGRYIVGDSTVLLTRINHIKETYDRTLLCVDAGFNLLIRPVLYSSYHRIIGIERIDTEPCYEYDVVGPLCESGDVLGRKRKLPRMKEGDVVAVLDTGAYGFSMSSWYNSRPRCAEILVRENNVDLIREKESHEDLIRHQILLKRLIT